ncbi:N-acetyl-D-Glu racemase DgcA [Elongatibacter sediminis]|uniref:Dipeptide epimerase n=1 Tax=Elongatibacter sediminis TaxID=3119006 RepID=A0AAW9RP07_9GAMM
MKFSTHIEEWEMRQPFRIAGSEFTHSRSLVVSLSDGQGTGRGEAQGAFYLGETAESMSAQLEALAPEIEQGLDRARLQEALPPGGARNALDCALWDLECKRSGQSIWQLTGIHPKPVCTVFTIGMETTPEAMAEKASAAVRASQIKVKLDADRPLEKLTAIRAARPDADLVVDANQSWTFELLQEILPACRELGIGMIEQPLPRGGDASLEGFDAAVPLCADESCLHLGEFDIAARRYDMINIKLDKTGGLTEALALARQAESSGCRLMVGNMAGTSLSMAPAFVIAQLCDYVDIDGPLLLRHDHINGLHYQDCVVASCPAEFWG